MTGRPDQRRDPAKGGLISAFWPICEWTTHGIERDVVNTGAPDDTLLAAGQGGTAPSQTSNVVKVNPTTLKLEELICHPNIDGFGVTTVVIQVANELWLVCTAIAQSPGLFSRPRACSSPPLTKKTTDVRETLIIKNEQFDPQRTARKAACSA